MMSLYPIYVPSMEYLRTCLPHIEAIHVKNSSPTRRRWVPSWCFDRNLFGIFRKLSTFRLMTCAYCHHGSVKPPGGVGNSLISRLGEIQENRTKTPSIFPDVFRVQQKKHRISFKQTHLKQKHRGPPPNPPWAMKTAPPFAP